MVAEIGSDQNHTYVPCPIFVFRAGVLQRVALGNWENCSSSVVLAKDDSSTNKSGAEPGGKGFGSSGMAMRRMRLPGRELITGTEELAANRAADRPPLEHAHLALSPVVSAEASDRFAEVKSP